MAAQPVALGTLLFSDLQDSPLFRAKASAAADGGAMLAPCRLMPRPMPRRRLAVRPGGYGCRELLLPVWLLLSWTAWLPARRLHNVATVAACAAACQPIQFGLPAAA